jgi:hypothetical protein
MNVLFPFPHFQASLRIYASVVLLLLLPGLAGVSAASQAEGRPLLVDHGKPNAQIVIAENPPRMVTHAASDLQSYVKKITGAELPIVTEPTSEFPLRIYVGQSEFTKELGLNDEGLKYGAYRMVSGPDWLALFGPDYDYMPPEPYPKTRAEESSEDANAPWDAITGAKTENPMLVLWRRFNEETGLWQQDEGGSYNAVCGFLHDLGVRWYMPGELGEVVPQMASIQLPEINRTVHPDYPLRWWHGAYRNFHPDTVFWDRRIGMSAGHELIGSARHVHGLKYAYHRPEVLEKNPELFAMWGGKPDPKHANLLSEEMVQAAAAYVRSVFDHFDEPAVSIWPADGLRQCETTKEMSQSDYVGQFMERVGKEVMKTHPDRLLTFGAYSGYRQPPGNVDQFPPNIMVFVAAHRPGLDDPDRWAERMALYEGWKKKTPNQPIIRNSNSYYEFIIHPRSFARELKALKGISLGDWNEVRRRPGGQKQVVWTTPGLDHLNHYVNARYLWDADQDIEALLDEYHTLFYGPARDQMKEAFDFAEANYTRGDLTPTIFPTEARIEFVKKLHEAKKSVEGTIYGQRIDLILSEIKPLDELEQDLVKEKAGRERTDAPVVTAAIGTEGPAETFTLVENATGAKADLETTFQVRWDNSDLLIEITCQEPDMENNFSTKNVWSGDNVAILIESQPGTGEYYHIEVNPDGDLVDVSRREHVASIVERWSAKATCEVEKGKDFWKVSLRLPIMGVEEGALDPFHNIVGGKPTMENPWFIQVGRARRRGQERSVYAFNPTLEGRFHQLATFARLVTPPQQEN